MGRGDAGQTDAGEPLPERFLRAEVHVVVAVARAAKVSIHHDVLGRGRAGRGGRGGGGVSSGNVRGKCGRRNAADVDVDGAEWHAARGAVGALRARVRFSLGELAHGEIFERAATLRVVLLRAQHDAPRRAGEHKRRSRKDARPVRRTRRGAVAFWRSPPEPSHRVHVRSPPRKIRLGIADASDDDDSVFVRLPEKNGRREI